MGVPEEKGRSRRLGAARPLVGYRDTGEGDVRHSRGSLIRAWVILAALVIFYLGWTLTVFFLEPGLR
jgi:hypothetical protein